jgi:rSAM/selenodomain-associated transferase 2
MSVSIIIPVLNEAACVGEAIRQARRQAPREIIVADGGSEDATREESSAADRLVSAPRGRSAQMNAGAAVARGDVLLFLHADCVLESGALADAERLLGAAGVAAGCFRMRVQEPNILYRGIEGCATARVRLTGLIYGDQGLFLRRELFERLGGFPPLRLMEDWFFSRQLRRHGRMVVSARHILVSSRRWRRQGVIRQTLRNWTLSALAVAGVHPNRLADFYPTVR